MWASRVRARRESLGLSQRSLAATMDPPTTQGTIWKIEHGRIAPHDSLKRSVARALRTSPETLFSSEHGAAVEGEGRSRRQCAGSQVNAVVEVAGVQRREEGAVVRGLCHTERFVILRVSPRVLSWRAELWALRSSTSSMCAGSASTAPNAEHESGRLR